MAHKGNDYSYVPAKISVGMFNGTCGFVTCKYKGEKWLQIGIFERLCKFKPHRQMSCETELKKAMSGAVFEYDNVPTTGFKYVKSNEDLYTMHRKWNERGDIVLDDPRGFSIAITDDNFFKLLESSGFNVKAGVIDRKLAYAWNETDCRFQLVDAETEKFSKVQAASSKILKKVDSTIYLTKRQLQLGRVYESKDGTKLMYMGEHSTYSGDCHLDAFDNGGHYALDRHLEDRTDCTRKDPSVFFRLDSNRYNQFYFLTSSCSKLLVKELDFDCNSIKYKGKPCTYENIKADMAIQPLFNMIAVDSIANCQNVPISLSTFRSHVFFNDYYGDDVTPQGFNWRTSWLLSQTFGAVEHRPNYGYDKRITFQEKRNNTNSWGYSWSNVPHERKYNATDIGLAYDELKVLAPVLYYGNGNRMPEEYALCFLRKDLREARY